MPAAHPDFLLPISDARAAECWPPRNGRPYNWKLSTQDAYHGEGSSFTEPFGQACRRLDYSYHRHPTTKRQVLQDAILHRVVEDHNHKNNDDVAHIQPPTRRPWLVLSAGPMGVGKSYALAKLFTAGYFSLDQFLKIYPDMIKAEIPEFSGYLRDNKETAATMLHGESSQMADILFQHALSTSLDMLVDGSLRNVDWYSDLITNQVRRQHPKYRIAILHVTANPQTIRERARLRARVSGRVVPTELLEESIRQVPISVRRLAALVDVTVTISNNEDEPIQLVATEFRGDNTTRVCSTLSWSDFAKLWQDNGEELVRDAPWTREKYQAQKDVADLVHCHMQQAWTDTTTQRTANAIWGAAYPNFCPRCTITCDDSLCGICVHQRHLCACDCCRGK